MFIFNSIKFYTAAFLILLLASCSSGDSSDTTTSSQAAQTGRVSLLITDGVTDDFDQVNLTVESISFIGSENGHETIVFNESRIINLLALQNYSDLLVTAVIPAGTYDKIRLHVSRVELVDLDGHCQPDVCITKLPANGKVDLNPRGEFEVFADGHLMVELDIDAEKSIHIIDKGNGKYSYNFRPVVFVNIVGVEGDDPKLVVIDGIVSGRQEGSFQICDDSDDVYIDEDDDAYDDDDEDKGHCLSISITDNTVVQNDLIEVVASSEVDNGDTVTVLAKVEKLSAATPHIVDALHVVIEAPDKAVSDLAMFNGEATSDFVGDSFTMDTEDNEAIIQPLTQLTIALVQGSGVRVFDKRGNVVSEDNIVVGTDLDVFGLAQPDLASVSKVKAAFVIIDNEDLDEKLSGTITAIDDISSQITVTVESDIFTGDVCVDATDSIIFILAIADGKVVNKQISIDQLTTGMLIDAYVSDQVLGCYPANALLVAEPLEVSPASALLITGD